MPTTAAMLPLLQMKPPTLTKKEVIRISYLSLGIISIHLAMMKEVSKVIYISVQHYFFPWVIPFEGKNKSIFFLNCIRCLKN